MNTIKEVALMIELGILTTDRSDDGLIHIDLKTAEQCIQKRAVRYDKTGDNHYDTISAFIKSMRGSDPDAVSYYLAKMLYAGEDIKFIARRIMICASEDVGNADPYALVVATNAALAVERIGMPEARIILSQAALYICLMHLGQLLLYSDWTRLWNLLRQPRQHLCRHICRMHIIRVLQS